MTPTPSHAELRALLKLHWDLHTFQDILKRELAADAGHDPSGVPPEPLPSGNSGHQGINVYEAPVVAPGSVASSPGGDVKLDDLIYRMRVEVVGSELALIGKSSTAYPAWRRAIELARSVFGVEANNLRTRIAELESLCDARGEMIGRQRTAIAALQAKLDQSTTARSHRA